MGRRLTDQERFYRSLTEKQHQKSVTDFATMYGWKWSHIADSRKLVRRGPGVYVPVPDPDCKGYPDLTLVHVRFGVAFVELKKELGKFEEGQEEWLDALCEAGVPAVCSRPSGLEQMQGWLMRGFPSAEECRQHR